MNIEFKCPQCGKTVAADESARGQVAECPFCGKGIVVPRVTTSLSSSTSPHPPPEKSVPRRSPKLGIRSSGTRPSTMIPPRLRLENDLGNPPPVPPTANPSVTGDSPKRRSTLAKVVTALCIIVGSLIAVGVISYGAYLYFGDVPRLERGIAHYENKRYDTAFKLLKPLAQKGIASAQLYLGDCYANGNGVFLDTEEAVKWYRVAADQELPEAQYRMFVCCRDGVGMERNKANAAKWCRKAANAGVEDAMFDMAGLYIDGIGVEKNEASAFRWYRKGAERGHTYSCFQLGLCYKNGIGTTMKDEDEAAKWQNKAVLKWRVSASTGDTEAMVVLGNLYMDGNVVELDKEEAARWFRKAAELGNAAAQCRLATCYLNGDGLDKDVEEAAKWMLKSAEQGTLSDSQWAMGRFYQEGKGVEKDMRMALMWFERAAKKGNSFAKNSLAICYLEGKGVPRDVAKAESILQEVIDNDDVDVDKDDEDTAKELAQKTLRNIRQEREIRARKLAQAKAEKEKKIARLSEIEDEIEERKGRVNSILKGAFTGKGRYGDSWQGFDAGKIAMTDASASVAEEQPLRRTSVKLSGTNSLEEIDASIDAAQKETERLEERLKDITRIKSIYDAKELESRKETCAPCEGKGSVKCARCQGSGAVLSTERKECLTCGDSGRKGQICSQRKCGKCGGSGQITPRCSTCNGTGVVRGSGIDAFGKRRLDTRETCNSCGGSKKGYPISCSECAGDGEVDVWQTCTTCRGRGFITSGQKETCPVCDGKGDLKCERCDGRGFTYRPKEGEGTQVTNEEDGTANATNEQNSNLGRGRRRRR